jgi:parallel beta-helix repeat protein
MTIESYLPPNCVTDGSVDYTAQLQKGLNAAEIIDMPPFPIMVNDRGLIIPSDREITFPLGSQIIQQPTKSGSYNAIRIQKAKNVTLHGPVIVGERDKHIGTTGEWGHGISIYGSSNVTIHSPNVTKCWGDGIYIAGSDGAPSSNITINNARCTYNRRNGIAIVSAIGLVLNSPYCGFTSGILPMCGIDIEPYHATDEIQGVVINNPRTERSAEYGIQIGLSMLYGGADKVISIKIVGHVDYYSKAAIKASVITLNHRIGQEKVSGVIDIINPFWKYNSVAPVQVNLTTKDIQLNIIKPGIQVNLKSEEILALLTKKTNINVGANYKLKF